ncbi:MAG: GDSL-type esterase/lipase family protein [Thermodesulfobacteriota bacterium]
MRKIICHGDSLTQGADIEPAFRWPSLLQNAMGGIETINTGIGGDTTAGLLSRYRADVVSQQPDAVILMGGTNDLWWGLPVNIVIANLYAMAYQARHHEIAPVFGLPTPFDIQQALQQPWNPPEQGYERLLKDIKTLTQRLAKEARESEIPVLEFHGLFMEDNHKVNPDLLLEDGVHPNGQGHREMAALAAAELKRIFLLP